MTFHREQAEKELIADGMHADEARISPPGGDSATTPACATKSSDHRLWFESIVQDFRFALRQLRKNPGFAVTAILILTLGIGASVAIFSFVDAALIKPLPYKDPSRLAVLFESVPIGPRFHLSYLDYLDWKRENRVFQSLDVYAPYGFMLQTPTGAQPADGASVSAGFFRHPWRRSDSGPRFPPRGRPAFRAPHRAD